MPDRPGAEQAVEKGKDLVQREGRGREGDGEMDVQRENERKMRVYVAQQSWGRVGLAQNNVQGRISHLKWKVQPWEAGPVGGWGNHVPARC